MLLPISMFEVEERLASFKGALLLGLRNDFGGDPDHLDVLPAELPTTAGKAATDSSSCSTGYPAAPATSTGSPTPTE